MFFWERVLFKISVKVDKKNLVSGPSRGQKERKKKESFKSFSGTSLFCYLMTIDAEYYSSFISFPQLYVRPSHLENSFIL